MRDRLIELLKHEFGTNVAEITADWLLANGVILLPCEIGQKLYDATEFFNGCCYPEIYELKENGMYLEKIDKGNIVFTYDGIYLKREDIGKTVFLTKEDAEKALKEKENV